MEVWSSKKLGLCPPPLANHCSSKVRTMIPTCIIGWGWGSVWCMRKHLVTLQNPAKIRQMNLDTETTGAGCEDPEQEHQETENVHRGSGQPPSHHTSWQSQRRSGIHSDTAETPRTSKEPSLADRSTENRQKILVFKKTLNWSCTQSNKNIFPVSQVRRSTNSNPERNWEEGQPLRYLGESLLIDWTFLPRNFGKSHLTLIPMGSLAYWLRTHNP